MGIGLLIFALVVATWAFLLWRAIRRPRVEPAVAFAALYHVELTTRNRAVLEATLERSRRFRYAGAVVVTIGYSVVVRDTGVWSLLGAIAVGFATGSNIDETTRPRESTAGSTGATLDRRSIFSFVERWVVVGLVASVSAIVAIGLVLLRLDQVGVAVNRSASVSGRAISIAAIVGVLAAALFGAALLRRLVLLPTGGSSSDLLAVRHALRMASVLTVVGAMFVIFGSVGVRLGQIAFLNDDSRRDLLQWTSNLATLISALSIVAGLSLSLRALPRTVDRPAATAPTAESHTSAR